MVACRPETEMSASISDELVLVAECIFRSADHARARSTESILREIEDRKVHQREAFCVRTAYTPPAITERDR
jgi:hypothetical protein